MESSTQSESKTVFKKLDASEQAVDSGDTGLTEIESVCMNCYERGTTRLLLTRIPFYRDVIISSFSCDHCHLINTGVESANKIQEKGVKYTLEVKSATDMNRKVVKSDYGVFQIPSIDFEIPALTQKGYMTTIEGILDRVITNLKQDIDARKEVDKETAERLEAFMQKVTDLKELKSGSFEIILDDPSGDSFVENPNAPGKDENMVVRFYKRSKEQNELIGLDEEETEETKEDGAEFDLTNEVATFEGNCPNCNAICQTNMKMTDIPFFKRVLIMCTICDNCGIKSSEVKSGEGVEPKGIKYTLKLTDVSDLNRDLLKSDYAMFEIPEIEFCMNEGTLGSKFTTLEGLLKDCVTQLKEVSYFGSADSGLFGDSQDPKKKNKMIECIEKLDSIQNGQMLGITIILDDPSGTSYLQNVYAPEEDPNLKVESYERTFEQNEAMGLNDMKTENYKEDDDS